MNLKKYILPIISVFAMASCDYEDVNRGMFGVTDDEMKQGGLIYGAPFMDMLTKVIPIGSPAMTTGPGNDLAVTDVMASGNYIGFWGMNNTWNYGTEASWNFTEARMSYAYKVLYSNLFKSWNGINSLVKDSDKLYDRQVKALANTVKIAAWLRATDVFGPIVYTSAGNGDIAPHLDSQEAVYKAMMADLHEIAKLLSQTVSKLLPAYDVIYDGNAQNWARLANSLMLRMAVRVHFVDQALAQEYIEKALDPQFGGVIENPAQEAKIMNSEKMPLYNSLLPTLLDYKEARMGSTIWSYLKGYNDPRIGVYFTQGTYDNKTDYYALPPTNNQPKREGKNSAEFASAAKVQGNSPLYWFRASEVSFLKAEAALYGLISGDPKTLYEEGITKSFEENGVSGVDSYLQSEAKPLDIASGECLYNPYYTCNISNGNVSPKWNDAGSQEQKLQQIQTQKYLALYPNAVEAWTEYRRTGYPYLMRPADKTAHARITADEKAITPERFRYSPLEYGANKNMVEVPGLLGGEDQGATRLWWVRNNRPVQP